MPALILRDAALMVRWMRAASNHAPPQSLRMRAGLNHDRSLTSRATARAASGLDRALRHDDGVATDGGGKELSRADLRGKAEQTRPAHLVALLDRDRVAAVRKARGQEAGESGGRRSGRGIFGDAHAGGEH